MPCIVFLPAGSIGFWPCRRSHDHVDGVHLHLQLLQLGRVEPQVGGGVRRVQLESLCWQPTYPVAVAATIFIVFHLSSFVCCCCSTARSRAGLPAVRTWRMPIGILRTWSPPSPLLITNSAAALLCCSWWDEVPLSLLNRLVDITLVEDAAPWHRPPSKKPLRSREGGRCARLGESGRHQSR